MKHNKKDIRSRWHLGEPMIDADYTDDPAIPANTPLQMKSQLLILKEEEGGIDVDSKANETEFMRFKQTLFTVKLV